MAVLNKLFQGQNKLIVLLSEPLKPEDNIVINIDKNGHKIEVTNVMRRNPYTLQFKMPCLYIVNTFVFLFVTKLVVG